VTSLDKKLGLNLFIIVFKVKLTAINSFTLVSSANF